MAGKNRGLKCPRCGKPGSKPHAKWVLNSEKRKYEPYYYVAHSVKKKGQKALKWCYLGKSPKGKRPKRKSREAH
jgi:hypothetical protein